ncbi:MAG: peptidoglycan-binding protein [Leptolyngbyaceae cyanobacterium RU_5_1]|nr:peptidoglycan-binding protein [Leptolyngbyaceae cyanobacterium RU_5_1]
MTSTVQINKPVLQLGSQGAAVKELQTLIVKLFGSFGYEEDRVAIDGIFGAITQGAVKEVQERFFLTVDGIAGSKTWAVLMTRKNQTLPVLRRGSRGDLVKRVQSLLNIHGYNLGAVDGDFGAKLEAAVKLFQSRYPGLLVDGIIGEKTWVALSHLYPYSLPC